MEVFADAFIETFESTTFQFLNPLDKIPEEDDGSGYFLGKCDFSGAINGSFSLIIHDNTVNEYLNFLFIMQSLMERKVIRTKSAGQVRKKLTVGKIFTPRISVKHSKSCKNKLFFKLARYLHNY